MRDGPAASSLRWERRIHRPTLAHSQPAPRGPVRRCVVAKATSKRAAVGSCNETQKRNGSNALWVSNRTGEAPARHRRGTGEAPARHAAARRLRDGCEMAARRLRDGGETAARRRRAFRKHYEGVLKALRRRFKGVVNKFSTRFKGVLQVASHYDHDGRFPAWPHIMTTMVVFPF